MELNQKFIDSIPKTNAEIISNSFICYKAYFSRFFILSLITTIPYFVIHMVLSSFTSTDINNDILSNLIILQTFDLLREGFFEVFTLFALVTIVQSQTVQPKEILSNFFTQYFGRVTFIIFIYFFVSLIAPSIRIVGYLLIIFLVFTHLACILLDQNWSLRKALQLSIKIVFQNFFLTFFMLFLMLLLAKIPEIIAVLNVIDESMLSSIEKETLTFVDLLSMFHATYLYNDSFIIISSVLKLILQPLKSIMFVFLFLHLLKKTNIQILNDYFSSKIQS